MTDFTESLLEPNQTFLDPIVGSSFWRKRNPTLRRRLQRRQNDELCWDVAQSTFWGFASVLRVDQIDTGRLFQIGWIRRRLQRWWRRLCRSTKDFSARRERQIDRGSTRSPSGRTHVLKRRENKSWNKKLNDTLISVLLLIRNKNTIIKFWCNKTDNYEGLLCCQHRHIDKAISFLASVKRDT